MAPASTILAHARGRNDLGDPARSAILDAVTGLVLVTAQERPDLVIEMGLGGSPWRAFLDHDAVVEEL